MPAGLHREWTSICHSRMDFQSIEVHHAGRTTQRGADKQDDGRRQTQIKQYALPLLMSSLGSRHSSTSAQQPQLPQTLTQHGSTAYRTIQVWRPAAGAKRAAADRQKGRRAGWRRRLSSLESAAVIFPRIDRWAI
jgi:hypothetical protein